MPEVLAVVATLIIAFPVAGWFVRWLAARQGLDPSADPAAVQPQQGRTGDVLADLAQREQQIAAQREQTEAAARAGLQHASPSSGAPSPGSRFRSPSAPSAAASQRWSPRRCRWSPWGSPWS